MRQKQREKSQRQEVECKTWHMSIKVPNSNRNIQTKNPKTTTTKNNYDNYTKICILHKWSCLLCRSQRSIDITIRLFHPELWVCEPDITGHLDILTWRTKGQKSSDWSFYLLYETNSTFQKAETTLTHLCSAVRRETVHQSEQKSSPPVKTPTWLLSKLPGVRLLILNPVNLSDPDPTTTVKLLEGHKMQNWVGGRRRHQKQ